ncbi:hypothetical protein HFN98_05760 [Rhizobium laguerreae]|uniref:hypothetical protein n=1 Tax=Rhizobium laguerreae TaxID=1076926 RepID=UPI001C907193|nr:hypothetical protein [Rhizobium laguerreae]MBY3330153.1 hypothetical protein [Rhizobium laguerreae]
MAPAHIIGSITPVNAVMAFSNTISGGNGVTEIISRGNGRASSSRENSIGLF